MRTLIIAFVLATQLQFSTQPAPTSVQSGQATAFGTVPVVMALFFLAGYGETAFYPSSAELQSSLTLQRASSSQFTLRTMFYVSFIIPFVVAYIWYAWRSINRKNITAEEMSGEDHMY